MGLLENRVVLVTGASCGIGRGVAVALARAVSDRATLGEPAQVSPTIVGAP